MCKPINDTLFKKANIEDIDEIIDLYVERMTWFKENGIKQWSRYLINHPKEQFINVIEKEIIIF